MLIHLLWLWWWLHLAPLADSVPRLGQENEEKAPVSGWHMELAACRSKLGALGVLVVHHRIEPRGRHRRQRELKVFPGAPSVPALAAGSGSRARH